ncbi:MAG TPA: winged helix-turn-helix domain-containing protein [Solirubrobacterales bacterium]|nr:winged helix-turn-helix domain-containing protein [Solirubrobacterales bacterium]
MTAATKPRGIDELVVFVVQHPIRVDVLQILNEREASATQIARQIGEDEKKVGHHVKALADAGCIELVRRVKNRGAEEHIYVASLRPHIKDAEWALLPRETRHEISALMFQAIVAEALSAFRNGTFDSRINRHVSWQPLKLDEQGWLELMQELEESLERIENIKVLAEQRLIQSGEVGMQAIAAALGFERGSAARARAPWLVPLDHPA